MKLLHLFYGALLVSATPLNEVQTKQKSCCNAKCYKRLEYADSHGLGNASRDCKSYQRTTMTPCPTTTTATSKATITVTVNDCQPSEKQRRDSPLEPRNNQPSCTPKLSSNSQPNHANGYCSKGDYSSACSCLGVKPTTITAPKSTITAYPGTKTVTAYGSCTTSSSATLATCPTIPSSCLATITLPPSTVTVQGPEATQTVTLTNDFTNTITSVEQNTIVNTITSTVNVLTTITDENDVVITTTLEVPTTIEKTITQSSTITNVPEVITITNTITQSQDAATITITNVPDAVTVTATTTDVPDAVIVTTTTTDIPNPLTVTITNVPDAITVTATTTDIPNPLTVTITDIPDAVTVTTTTTEIPNPITVTETPDPITVTETPDPITVTETQDPVTVTTCVPTPSPSQYRISATFKVGKNVNTYYLQDAIANYDGNPHFLQMGQDIYSGTLFQFSSDNRLIIPAYNLYSEQSTSAGYNIIYFNTDPISSYYYTTYFTINPDNSITVTDPSKGATFLQACYGAKSYLALSTTDLGCPTIKLIAIPV